MVPFMAGQIAGLVRKKLCAEILEDLYTGAAKVIKSCSLGRCKRLKASEKGLGQ